MSLSSYKAHEGRYLTLTRTLFFEHVGELGKTPANQHLPGLIPSEISGWLKPYRCATHKAQPGPIYYNSSWV